MKCAGNIEFHRSFGFHLPEYGVQSGGSPRNDDLLGAVIVGEDNSFRLLDEVIELGAIELHQSGHLPPRCGIHQFRAPLH